MKYMIGDVAWHAEMKHSEARETCPDCFGTKALTVILGDGTQLSIPCAGCAIGCNPPRGYVVYSTYGPDVRQVCIERIEVEKGGVKYGHSERYTSPETDLFDTKEEAEARAQEKAEEYTADAKKRAFARHDNNRTWAWHVHYHRGKIRDAEKSLKYHTENLNAAKDKAKVQKGNES